MDTTIEVTLKDSDARALRAATKRRDTSKAVAVAVEAMIERGKLAERYPRPHVPNATTARALRSKKPGKVFSNAKDAIAYLKSL